MSRGQGYRDRINPNKGVRVTVDGLDKIILKLNKLAEWSVKDSAKMVKINKRVGMVNATALKANVKDYKEDINVTTKNKDGEKSTRKVYKGQLRRSSGVWRPNRDRNTILSGPRTRSIGKRGKTPLSADGWFAHIVEKGDFAKRFGGKHRTQNTGVFERTKKATQNRAKKLQVLLLRQEFAKYTSKL